jgi:cellulose synthase/poly-beta-1,6-N-acetylglucosamine synthase-like glycosyltransferase
MSILSILFYLFIIIGMIHLVHFAAYLIGGNFYDVVMAYKNRGYKKLPPYKPLVSVIVPAHNEELVIERCLQSVWSNTYDNIEVIVVNDGSSDSTAERVQRFINSRMKVYSHTSPTIVRTENGLERVWQRGYTPITRRIKLISQRNNGKASALNNGIRYHAKGELIMTLDADSLLHKKAIANSVKYFKDPKIAGVAANVRVIEERTVLGILQRFEHIVSYRSKKLFTMTNCELIVGGVASTYRRRMLDSVRQYGTDTVTEDIGLSMKIAARGNRKNRLIYAADVAAMTEGVEDFQTLLRQRYRWKLGSLQNLVKYRRMLFSRDKKYTKMLTFYRVPMAFFGELLLLLEPVVLAYVIYISTKFLTPALFISAYMTITIYVLMIIWPDEHLDLWGKVKASIYTPLLYFVFYIMNIVQLVSIIRCLINGKQIVSLKETRKTWISPKRSGKTISFSRASV